MRSIAAAIIVVASAWMWQTTSVLYLFPSGSNEIFIGLGVVLTFTAFIVGLREFQKGKSGEKASLFLPARPPKPLPPQTVTTPPPGKDSGKS